MDSFVATICIGIAVFLFLKISVQAVTAIQLCRLFFKQRTPESLHDKLPKATVLVSLRGSDPGLRDSLRKLMDQDYPDYALRIVVDSQDDPAWNCAQAAMSDGPSDHVHLEVMRNRRTTCGLKCSALVQAAEQLDDSCELIVVADADVNTHPTWLRQLAQPFEDPSIGAAYGNRWFWPKHFHVGSVVRYLWNAAAVMQMYQMNIPWGGSLAIRAKSFHEADIIGKWRRSITDDAPIIDAIQSLGQRSVPVPELMMVNDEQCGMDYSLEFIKRQLTWIRLYHSGWSRILVQSIALSSFQLSLITLVVLAVVTKRPELAYYAVAAYAINITAMIVNLTGLECGVRHVVGKRGVTGRPMSLSSLAMIIACIPLVEFTHLAAVTLATVKRSVRWRGVTYLLEGPWNIRMIDYSPFQDTAAQNHSI